MPYSHEKHRASSNNRYSTPLSLLNAQEPHSLFEMDSLKFLKDKDQNVHIKNDLINKKFIKQKIIDPYIKKRILNSINSNTITPKVNVDLISIKELKCL